MLASGERPDLQHNLQCLGRHIRPFHLLHASMHPPHDLQSRLQVSICFTRTVLLRRSAAHLAVGTHLYHIPIVFELQCGGWHHHRRNGSGADRQQAQARVHGQSGDAQPLLLSVSATTAT